MIEKDQKVGVTFTPRLAQQRMDWTLEVLRREGVTSVLDIGCGEGEMPVVEEVTNSILISTSPTGTLLNILSQPASSVPEAPIRPVSNRSIAEEEDGDDDGAFAMDGIESTSGTATQQRRNSMKGSGRKVNGVVQELFLHVSTACIEPGYGVKF